MCKESDGGCGRRGEGSADDGGVSSKMKLSCSSWVAKRRANRFRRFLRRETLAGKRRGSAFRMMRYSATKLPVKAIRGYMCEECGEDLAWQRRGMNPIRRAHVV